MSSDVIPDRRVCEIYTAESSGSGLLITDRLVLTANHVLGGAEAQVRFPEGSFECVVHWRSEELDAAVLRITDETWVRPTLPPLRWGRFVTGSPGIPAEAAGFPESHSHEWAHASGVLNALDRRGTARIDLQVGSWPRQAPGRSLWCGMSGAALFSGGLLTGLVIEDPPEFESRRLTAVRIQALRAHPGFEQAVWGSTQPPPMEPAEIAGLCRSPLPIRVTPAGLLRAEAEIVPFHGRDDVLRRLREWLDPDVSAAVRVLTGPGGQGKTRVARQFARVADEAGWLVAEVRDDAPAGLIERLPDVREPLLLIVDEAEKQADRLVRIFAALPGRVRVLLVARTGGPWLRKLAVDSEPFAGLLPHTPSGDDLAGVVEELGPIGGDRRAAFRAALTAYAGAFGRPATGIRTPRLTDECYGNVLAVHMEAMAALLNAADAPADAPAGAPDAAGILLQHEMRYWSQLARTKYALGDLPDEVLRQTITVATLCTVRPRTGEDLDRILSQVPLLAGQLPATRAAVAEWLTDLYSEPGWKCAPLRPGPLHEHLVGAELADHPAMLDSVAPILTERQACEMLTVLARSGAPVSAGRRRDYRVVVAVAGAITALVRGAPERMAFPAWFAAALVEGPAAEPLHAALDAIEHGEAARGRLWRQSISDAWGAVGDAFGRFRGRTRNERSNSVPSSSSAAVPAAAVPVGGGSAAHFRMIAQAAGAPAGPSRLRRVTEAATMAVDRIARTPWAAPVIQAVHQHPDLARGLGAAVAVVALASPLLLIVPESEAGQSGAAPVRDGIVAVAPLPAPGPTEPTSTAGVGEPAVAASPHFARSPAPQPSATRPPSPAASPISPSPAPSHAASSRPATAPPPTSAPTATIRPSSSQPPILPRVMTTPPTTAPTPSASQPTDGRFPIEVDADSLTAPTFSIPGVDTDANAGRPQHYRLKPGRYGLSTGADVPLAWFKITPTGTVDYEPDVTYLKGRGTTRLEITGLEVTIDPTPLDAESFGLGGVGSNLDDDSVHRMRLLPARYRLALWSIWTDAYVTLLANGTFTYHLDHDTFLSGRDTSRLTLNGLKITVDATQLKSSTFSIEGVASGRRTSEPLSVRVLPAPYRLADGPTWSTVKFTVTLDGHLTYIPAHATHLSGADTSTLTIRTPTLPPQ
ncbi:trypsin-like peptidase domain-containing protein [Actinoplanes sp. GCM10030250]|uniref:trypsin-like peptidase domain-containing protein n=1 Tax=Actinoplanes sp. GCM10030250 TaxID=3273376 RepID=UPI003608F3BC